MTTRDREAVFSREQAERNRKVREEKHAQIRKIATEEPDLTRAQIAERCGIAGSTVSAVLKAAGIRRSWDYFATFANRPKQRKAIKERWRRSA